MVQWLGFPLFNAGATGSILGQGTTTSAGDLRELPRVPLRGEGCCVVGRVVSIS